MSINIVEDRTSLKDLGDSYFDPFLQEMLILTPKGIVPISLISRESIIRMRVNHNIIF